MADTHSHIVLSLMIFDSHTKPLFTIYTTVDDNTRLGSVNQGRWYTFRTLGP